MLDFYPNERFAVFIDSANFRRSKQSINMYVDDGRPLLNISERIMVKAISADLPLRPIPKEDLSSEERRIGAPHPSPLGLHI